MLNSNNPPKILTPFANSAGASYIRTVPVPSQIGITNGAASFTDGFPPVCFIPQAAGGYPPDGRDVNYVLQLLSKDAQWNNAGGYYAYDSSFSTAIGGYPKGAVLARADSTGFLLSTADNNTLTPETDTTGAWFPISNSGITTVSGLTNANVTLTSLQYAKNIIIFTGVLTANINIIFPTLIGVQWLLINNTTGAFSITCKTSLGSGFLVPNTNPQIGYGDGTNLVQVPLGLTQSQADARYAALAGLNTQIFRVANSVGVNDAVALGQFAKGTNKTILPNGMILQYGSTALIGTISSLAVVLPTAYTTEFYYQITSLTLDTATGTTNSVVSPTSLTGLTINNRQNNSAQFYWFAIGY